MSEPQRSRPSTGDMWVCSADEKFLQNLVESVQQEKRHVTRSEGPDRLRHALYRSVFSKVIARTTAYKRLLLTIKTEYDDIIRELQRKEEEAESVRRTLTAFTSRCSAVMTCRHRATGLRLRISVLQRETAELQEQIRTRESSNQQSCWIPGLTVVQSEDPEALDRHLQHLDTQRAALLDRRTHCVSLELEAVLQAAEHHRDQLRAQNQRLMILNRRLRFVSELLSSQKDDGTGLEELLVSTLENVRHASSETLNAPQTPPCLAAAAAPCRINRELFEDDEPTGVDEAELLSRYLDRFSGLFDRFQLEEAALLATKSPAGVLRNLDTLDLFRGVEAPRGSAPWGLAPPLLLYLQALLVTVPPGDQLSADLSLQAVRSALQHGALQLVAHAITHNKLTPSEGLGDLLTEHADPDPSRTDACLSLATGVYKACRLDRKVALSMCRRGHTHSAAEFMKHSKFTAEDCMWVLCRSPNLSLLQLLVEPQQGQSAILSVGGACCRLLVDPQQQELGLQLLDSVVSRGRGILEEVVLEDSSPPPDVWTHLCSLCSELNRSDLSQAIVSVLLDQSGTGVLSPDLEGAQLIEHIFL